MLTQACGSNDRVKVQSFSGCQRLPPLPFAADSFVARRQAYVLQGRALIYDKARAEWEANPDLWNVTFESPIGLIVVSVLSPVAPGSDRRMRPRGKQPAVATRSRSRSPRDSAQDPVAYVPFPEEPDEVLTEASPEDGSQASAE